jgi:hypothetical protein
LENKDVQELNSIHVPVKLRVDTDPCANSIDLTEYGSFGTYNANSLIHLSELSFRAKLEIGRSSVIGGDNGVGIDDVAAAFPNSDSERGVIRCPNLLNR